MIDDYTSKWGYNQINDNQKEIYKRFINSAKNLTSKFDTSDLLIYYNDVNTAYWAFDYDNPQFLELGSGFSYSYILSSGVVKSVEIEYSRTAAEIDHSKFNSIVKDVLAEAKAKPSDYEKLKYVHDWIINNTAYIQGNTAFESEADGPVVYGKAICEGYAKAFMYFAQSLGFPCVCVIGGAGGTGHMWNMVKVGGQWYNVDATWDDPVMSDGSQMIRHKYFLISDSEIRRDHSVDNPFALPSAPQSYAQ